MLLARIQTTQRPKQCSDHVRFWVKWPETHAFHCAGATKIGAPFTPLVEVCCPPLEEHTL